MPFLIVFFFVTLFTVIHKMSAKLKCGDCVLVEASKSEIYEGTIVSISSNHVEICDVFRHIDRRSYVGPMTFYRDEVNNITIVSEPKQLNSNTATSINTPFDSPNNCKLDPDEYKRLQDMTHYSRITFVDTFDTKYRDAVAVLKNRESVAVVGLGNTTSRMKSFSLLVMGDFKEIFIFDLFCLVDLGDLKEILESSFIYKIVHDGAFLYDCLYHKYGVDMQNVFDTQVVDSVLAEEKKETKVKRDIKECLNYHLNLPYSLLWAAIDDMPNENWWHRPVTKSDRGKAAQLVAYLPTLRDCLMAQILKKYTDTTVTLYTKQKNTCELKFNK